MNTEVSRFDALVLGGGAAGLMCAIEAGRRGRRVGVLERADRIGKKILISGGGRCNFTNLNCQASNFLSSNQHFVKSALARYRSADFIGMVERHRIRYHEKTLGQLFCDGSAREITEMLERECRQAGVCIYVGSDITAVRRTTEYVIDAGAHEFRAPALVVATGGLSIPKMGATGFGYDIARQFGLRVRECRPALVPLTLSAEDREQYCDLAGVSTEVVASRARQAFREKMLITHRGLSGPAILQISSYWGQGESIQIDLAPGAEVALESHRRDITGAKNALRQYVPARLADRWMERNAPPRWTQHAIGELERRIHSWTIAPEGTEGYEKAEVTAGGVDTDELSAKTMESRRVPGLYFIGEVVDVTGQLGGYNFQWAWASGYCAGEAL